jgi:hypothetical protein
MNLSDFYLEQAHKLHLAAVSLKESADKIKASSNSIKKKLEKNDEKHFRY